MQKRKIITVGNSFAVVIPKEVCRLLRLDRKTEVNLVLQDDNILIRPIQRADRTGQPDRFRVGKVIVILTQHYGMSQADFARLSADGASWTRFVADVQIGGHLNLITVARLDECLGRRRELERARKTESWDETVDAVVLKIPSDQPVATASAANDQR